MTSAILLVEKWGAAKPETTSRQLTQPLPAALRLFAVGIADFRPPLLRRQQNQRAERAGDERGRCRQEMDDQRVPDKMRNVVLQLGLQGGIFLRREPGERLRQRRQGQRPAGDAARAVDDQRREGAGQKQQAEETKNESEHERPGREPRGGSPSSKYAANSTELCAPRRCGKAACARALPTIVRANRNRLADSHPPRARREEGWPSG